VRKAVRKEISVTIPTLNKKVSAIWESPPKPIALFAFAHGAGAGMCHSSLEAIAQVLLERDIAVFRYQFPYMEEGSRRPDSPKIATATVAAAVEHAHAANPKLKIFAGGKSFGSRMTTQAAAQGLLPSLSGIICFGFPLHPPKKPGVERAEHLGRVKLPVLFLQGTRDALCDLNLFRPIVKRHARRFKLHVIEGADHSYSVLKSSGRTPAEVLAEVADATRAFCNSD